MMVGLQTSRVLVIDDVPEEADPILTALGKHGVGTVYLRGDRLEDLPSRPLRGIRLLFLDMDLGVGGTPRAVVTNTLQVLLRAVADDGVPIVTIIWTQHPEYVEEFKNLCRGKGRHLDHELIFDFTKPADLTETGPAEDAISEALKSHSPLDILWYWEESVHDAASGTSSALAELLDPKEAWKKQALAILAAIARAVGGATVRDSRSALVSLFAGMIPLLRDRLEHYSHTRLGVESTSSPLVEAVTQAREKSELTSTQLGEINAMLMLASASGEETPSQPGNVYVRQLWHAGSFPLGPSGSVTNADLIADTIELPNPESRRKDSEKQRARQARKRLLRRCLPILLEVTPPCDHSQNKARMGRMIAGLRVPVTEEKKIRRGDFIKQIGVVHHTLGRGKRPTTSILVLNAHFVFGLPLTDLEKQKCAARLRSDALRDVLAWYGAHAARPGYVALR